MPDVQFDQDIPVPEHNERKPRGSYEFLNEMEVGDSKLLEASTNIQSFRVSCYIRRPKKFITRKEDGGWRVWRKA